MLWRATRVVLRTVREFPSVTDFQTDFVSRYSCLVLASVRLFQILQSSIIKDCYRISFGFRNNFIAGRTCT